MSQFDHSAGLLALEEHGAQLIHTERLLRFHDEFPWRHIPQNDEDGISSRRKLVLLHGVLIACTLHFRPPLAFKTLVSWAAGLGSAVASDPRLYRMHR